jgi:transposase-like protein
MAKRKRYDDEFRASAIVMLEAAGYPNTPGALAKVASHLKMPAPTLHRWFHEKNNPAPSELVNIKKGDMANALEEVAWKLLDSMADSEAIADAPLQQRATAYGIAIDKMRLLRGLPTEIVALIPDVVNALQSMGQSPAEVFNRIIQRAKQEQQRRSD